MQSLKTSLGRLRVIGWWEGVSFLLLLGVAMPLKYFADWPLGVRYVGMAHGILFLLYVVAAIQASTSATTAAVLSAVSAASASTTTPRSGVDQRISPVGS